VADPRTLAALRALVAAWTPPDAREGAVVPTGVPVLDRTLGGGLPSGHLSELVCPPGRGGQLVLARLLETTRAARQRVALIDATDAFAPEAVPPDLLRHLVWVRGRSLTEALGAADILVRDGNYGVVLLDLRDVPVAALQRTPKTLWHRLHRAIEPQPAAALVLSRHGFVPAVRWRLMLTSACTLTNARVPRSERAEHLGVETVRGSLAEALTA
jgi:hypothetical protein